jgi:hypothetical protein
MSLAALGVLLLTQLGALHTKAQGIGGAWPLTADGRSRFAGWSPDSRTVLVNRWGAVVGDGTTRQALSELWAVDVRSGPSAGLRRTQSSRSGRSPATRLSENAVQPAYTADGERLAYLAFAGDGRWEARVLDLVSGQEKAWATADWRTVPVWVSGRLAFVQNGRVWLSSEGARAVPAGFPALPAGARVRLAADGGRAAWSDGTHLRALPHPDGEPWLLVADAQVLNFAWSPDGKCLAYVIAAENPSPELWVADVAGEDAPVLLARGQAEVFSTPSWSPDGRTLAFSRTPLGAATASASDIWLVNADGGDLRPLLRNDLEESSPAWSPDGRYLAFNRAGDVWVLDVPRPLPGSPPRGEGEERGGERPLSTAVSLPPRRGKGQGWRLGDALERLVQQTPPVTIRVIHREGNYYRYDVPIGQIDVITFETYVKRVVPVEISASFYPVEAIKAQAVAARTYAWYYTMEHADWDWDLSDWTDYQVMGREDQRHPRSDAATDDTQGQYIAYQGNVIKAFYSAENGCPTRGLEGYDYIQAVDDPVSFGQERWGHGWGMSQRGARRWAEWHGWGCQQILAHYYTGVTVELPSTGGPMPIGGVTLPWSDFFITSNRVYVVTNASDETSDVSAVGFYAVTDTTTLLVTDTVSSDGWSTVWDVAALSDTTSTAITLSLLVDDGEGNVQSQAETVHIGLDRQPLTDATASIHDATADTITVTLSSLSAIDPSPGSGLQAMAFSNEGWAWEGEDLWHESGEAVDDEDALNGKAWHGLAGTHSAGAWYGPYTYNLPPGRAYRAYFRLKTNDVTTTAEVATLDVVDNAGTRVLGLRRLRGTDFRAPDTYQEFPVDFNYTDTGTFGLEFRTAFRSTADLYLDRVLIVGYPINVANSAKWRLTPGEGLKTVTVKFIDGAGNVSGDLTTTVTLSDTTAPTGWRDFAPEWWDGGSLPTCTIRVFDEISGLNVDSARYRFSTDGGVSWSDWLVATCTGISGTTEIQTITASSVPFGQPRATANRIEFQIADVKGHTSTAIYTVRSRILYLPLIMKH